MSSKGDVYEMIKDIIEEETIYLKHYIGKVVDVNDISRKGRVKVTIPELGLDTPALALWCFPRQSASLIVPKVNSYAEVYFINGDRTKPVYLYPASSIIDNIPNNYDGNIATNVLFEDPNNSNQYIKFDSVTQILTLLGDPNNIKIDSANGTVTILNGTESYVLGDSFLSWLTNFINNIFNLHTHLYNPGPGSPAPTGAPSITDTPPSNILSTLIKGK